MFLVSLSLYNNPFTFYFFILFLRSDGGVLGSSPSSFTTRETKVHMVCESKLDNWRSQLVCLG